MNSDEVFYKSDIRASKWRFGVIFSYIAVRCQCILVWKIQEKKMTDLMIALLIKKKNTAENYRGRGKGYI